MEGSGEVEREERIEESGTERNEREESSEGEGGRVVKQREVRRCG